MHPSNGSVQLLHSSDTRCKRLDTLNSPAAQNRYRAGEIQYRIFLDFIPCCCTRKVVVLQRSPVSSVTKPGTAMKFILLTLMCAAGDQASVGCAILHKLHLK
jgi:hypothetical protein